ncbi:hypothetical protein IHE61_30960 [Streptomyces sp. GKU 257-1]|nr:hypothetical protein [Streptomyces sp. GKU 257-1]
MTAGDESREAAAQRLMRDAVARWSDMGPVELGMTRYDAWLVLMALQTAVSHPELAGPTGARMERIGRQIQEAVCDDAEVYAAAEAAWHRAGDARTADGESA